MLSTNYSNITMLEDILKTKSDFAITDNTLIFRFRE